MSEESEFEKQLKEIRQQRSSSLYTSTGKIPFGPNYFEEEENGENDDKIEYHKSLPLADDQEENDHDHDHDRKNKNELEQSHSSYYQNYQENVYLNDYGHEDLKKKSANRAFTATKDIYDDIPMNGDSHHESDLIFEGQRKYKIAERETDYQSRRRHRVLSPERVDPFLQYTQMAKVGVDGGERERNEKEILKSDARGYSEIMQEQELNKEETELMKRINEKKKDKQLKQPEQVKRPSPPLDKNATSEVEGKKKRRWDMETQSHPPPSSTSETSSSVVLHQKIKSHEPETELSEWERPDEEEEEDKESIALQKKSQSISEAKAKNRWDATPQSMESSTMVGERDNLTAKKRRWDETPISLAHTPTTTSWEQTPSHEGVTPGRARSRWDETPISIGSSAAGLMTPSIGIGGGFGGETPFGNLGMMTPSLASIPMTPEHMASMRMEREMDIRNRPFTDMDLDSILPSEGYVIVEPPASYIPIRTPSRRLAATPTPYEMQGFSIAPSQPGVYGGSAAAFGYGSLGMSEASGDLQLMKPEDYQYFSKLTDGKADEDLEIDEIKERKIMRLLLKIKNGTPPMRKSALRQITEKAREFGAGLLFDKILPLLMSPSLEDQERHLLVKVIDRILFKLDDLVRPYVHKILVVIEPLLIDEDYYTRVEGREIISNLSKAAGLATMIASMRPDIDHSDEYVRNTTARAFSVVASALGIPALLPFIKAVCNSKKSWAARHTGIKIVQQIAILIGSGIVPHLKSLVDCIAPGLTDEQQKVRTITALALSALAEASAPFGIESFDSVLKPLWKGIRQHRSKALAAFLKAIGYIVPLMDTEYANFYTRDVMEILIREFQTPDEEMKKIVLKVVKQCVSTEGVKPDYIKEDILPEFFRHFWIRRMALDKRNYKQLVETTAELANKVGVAEIVRRIVTDLKDESEPYRKMVMEAIEKIIGSLGSADIDARLEEQLIDGVLYSFQEQSVEDITILSGFGTVVNSLGHRTKPYLQQICSTILWRLNNKSAKVRQQAADLVARIAPVMITCHEEKLLGHLGLVLYEYLGEEYPEVLGSILGGLKAIVNVIGMNRMNPPIKDILPRLTPILKNRHEKVQENCIDLVGRIADRGAEAVSPREWMRICFELLELLKAHKKAIRRAAVNTFGYIAKAIGPQDVLATLLNNLKVQERQNRVCTTVAIAIVAENCSPFTILPALMNEYRVPELNVQNGVLKSLSFLFEYIGEMGRDYIYSVAPLLEDALMDRDLVHRQTACTAVKHMSLGVYGLGCEDALLHLLNYVWPNIFETSPHVISATLEAIDGLRLSLGPGVVFNYIVQGLFHPARKVREIYWKIYNSIYIGHQDAMAAYFPRVELENSRYIRHELDLWL